MGRTPKKRMRKREVDDETGSAKRVSEPGVLNGVERSVKSQGVQNFEVYFQYDFVPYYNKSTLAFLLILL